jgi:hypothetical protein
LILLISFSQTGFNNAGLEAIQKEAIRKEARLSCGIFSPSWGNSNLKSCCNLRSRSTSRKTPRLGIGLSGEDFL